MNYFESTNNNSFSMAENKKKIKAKTGNNTQKLSTDPQSVAARERRHRISNRFKTLQSLVPGGSKLDTVSMLDEAIHYVHYLKTQIMIHQNMINFNLDDHYDNNVNDQPPQFFIYSQQQQEQQQQPEFFDAGYQPSSVPTLANYCYQLGEGTSYCDGYMQQY